MTQEHSKTLPRQYWGERFTPEPGQASATGRDAAAALEQAAANMNQRLYTQREVEQMIQFWEEAVVTGRPPKTVKARMTVFEASQ